MNDAELCESRYDSIGLDTITGIHLIHVIYMCLKCGKMRCLLTHVQWIQTIIGLDRIVNQEIISLDRGHSQAW